MSEEGKTATKKRRRKKTNLRYSGEGNAGIARAIVLFTHSYITCRNNAIKLMHDVSGFTASTYKFIHTPDMPVHSPLNLEKGVVN